ncbi:cupredoxin domain-containing protein [Candidatus Daviesbacteria bacterium]|nr:cupredoxin domain-containing protein [Candidatus Daviesbacteria bacterium]
MNNQDGSYGKRPLWQWVLIYVVIGLVVYGLIYYFILARKGGSTYGPPSTAPANSTPATSSASENQQDTIVLTADGFSPATLTVKTGTKVILSNQSGIDATVNSSPHPTHTDYPPLNLGSLPVGGTVSMTFDKPGTYKYHNHLKPSQFGTIVVE